jgi:RNA polymerase subunit RPABC4/transcription elongation factor Spt4
MVALPCPKCGAPNAADDSFCARCGSPLHSGTAGPPRSPVANPPTPVWAPASGPWSPHYWPQGTPFVEPPRPTAAMILTVLGGVFILLGAVFEVLVGAALDSIFLASASEVFVLSGFLGIGVGGGVLLLGVLVHLQPKRHTIYGVLILVLAVVSLVSFFGGFFLGFVLALVGGILAIAYDPSPVPGPIQYVMAPPILRVCPKCGRVVDLSHRFCPFCGNPLG